MKELEKKRERDKRRKDKDKKEDERRDRSKEDRNRTDRRYDYLFTRYVYVIVLNCVMHRFGMNYVLLQII